MKNDSEHSGIDFSRLSRRLAAGSGVVFIGQILGRALGFVLQLFLGRMLGASGYGIYALCISVVESCGQLSQLGIGNGLVRFVAMHRADSDVSGLKGTLLDSFGVGLAASIVMAAVVFLAAPWLSGHLFHEPAMVLPIRIVAFALPFYNLASLVQSALRGSQKMVFFSLAGVARTFITLVAAGALILAGLGVAGAVGGFAAANLLASVIALLLLARTLPTQIWRVDAVSQLRNILRFSLPVYLAGFSFVIMSRADMIMLGYFSSSSYVGKYRAAVALAHVAVFALGAINTAFAPMIADLYRRGEHDALSRTYKTVARWSTLLCLFVALPLVLFPSELLGLYGTGFQEARWALILLTVSQVVNAGVGSVGFMLQMCGRQDWVLANNLFSAALNIALNFWWIPRWGIIGAAAATGLSIAANNLLGMIEVLVFLKTHPFDRDYLALLFPVIGSFAVFNIVEATGLPWWQNLACCCVGFSAVFFAAGLNGTDRMVLKAALRRVSGRSA